MPQEAIYSSSRPQELQPIVTDSLDQFGRERVAHFSRDLTKPAMQLLEIVAAANFFLVMFAFGIFLDFRFSRLSLVLAAVFLRMGVGLFLGFALAILFSLSGINGIVVRFATGMPVGMNVLVYAVNEKLDSEFAVNLISLSLTVGLALVTVLAIILPGT